MEIKKNWRKSYSLLCAMLWWTFMYMIWWCELCIFRNNCNGPGMVVLENIVATKRARSPPTAEGFTFLLLLLWHKWDLIWTHAHEMKTRMMRFNKPSKNNIFGFMIVILDAPGYSFNFNLSVVYLCILCVVGLVRRCWRVYRVTAARTITVQTIVKMPQRLWTLYMEWMYIFYHCRRQGPSKTKDQKTNEQHYMLKRKSCENIVVIVHTEPNRR